MCKRGLFRQVPAFFAFVVVSAVSELTVYAADVLPSVRALIYWRINWAGILTEGVLKIVLISEIFAHVFASYSSVARLSRFLIRGLGAALFLVAVAVAAYAPPESPYGIISGARLLEQTTYLIESGLLLFIFLLSSYFHMAWKRHDFGITLGLALSSCVHLATWTLMTNGGLPNSKRIILIFLNMAAYHAVVLMWFYYLLIPSKVESKAPELAVPLPENNLAVWNRELERLLQQ